MGNLQITAKGELTTLKTTMKRPMPKDTEQLRSRITLLGTAWIMVKLNQGNAPLLVDVEPGLFRDYLTHLLGKQVALIGYKAPGEGGGVPTYGGGRGLPNI